LTLKFIIERIFPAYFECAVDSKSPNQTKKWATTSIKTTMYKITVPAAEGTRCFWQVATIRQKIRVGGGDDWVSECNSLPAVLLSRNRVNEQLHIWRTRQPSQALHMSTAMVLPLKPQPAVLCTKNIQEKAAGIAQRKTSQLQPGCQWLDACKHLHLLDYLGRSSLPVLATEGQQHCEWEKTVGSTNVLHPVLTHSPQRASIVTDMTGKGCINHVMQLFHRKACRERERERVIY